MPPRRLVAADTALGVVRAIIVGCAIDLALDLAAMLVATLAAPAADGAPDGGLNRIGLGVLAVSTIGLLVFGLLAGALTVPARLALASLYAGLRAKSPELRDTIVVRGQVPPSPTSAASAAAITLGGMAMLATIPCVVLAAEHAGRLGGHDDGPYREEFLRWAWWSIGLIALAAACAVAVVVMSRRSRAWLATTGAALPPEALGERGPAARVTTRAERRAARGSRSPLERWNTAARVAVGVGALALFLGLYVHQPSLYAGWTALAPAAEGVIGVIAVCGGALIAIGLPVWLTAALIGLRQTRAALRVVGSGSGSGSGSDAGSLVRVREASTVWSRAVETGTAWWTAVAVIAAGCLLGAAAVGAGPGAEGAWWPVVVVALVWLLGMAFLVVARRAVEQRGPELRNRFGFAPPSEPDDREFPNLTFSN